eukprot:CAMPEP_0114613646 /NCGR_PEP_ID=MMETSP0168-20121206/5240_1 /TAXON_ID=95228 ORGANISM="Vannella sp., Strain DIVA3 517/6/12" /NCGR_SAMPLE_ID=MMETSP0168 /ASSEMBLY_ACC=CAM_ASM_000044 /LENGTH=304 /DNA_ID=CAMNT_0001824659 /DNA_START=28 /DNA_END=942 /DNA_ORIENTATION=-
MDATDEVEMLSEVLEGVQCCEDGGCTRVTVPVLPDYELLQADIVFRLTDEYCSGRGPPEFELDKVRGLTEEDTARVLEALHEEAATLDDTMLYQLHYTAGEKFRELELPTEPCATCMEHFTDAEDVFRTPCYHYFHKPCFTYWHVVCLDTEDERVAAAPSHKAVERNEDPTWCPVCRLTVPSNTLEGLEDLIEKDRRKYKERKAQQARIDRREEERAMAEHQASTGEVALLFTALGNGASDGAVAEGEDAASLVAEKTGDCEKSAGGKTRESAKTGETKAKAGAKEQRNGNGKGRGEDEGERPG